MNYFNDISFVTYGITDWVENTACGRRFEGYYGIQYVFDGEIFAHVNENPVEIAEGPVVFITYPASLSPTVPVPECSGGRHISVSRGNG